MVHLLRADRREFNKQQKQLFLKPCLDYALLQQRTELETTNHQTSGEKMDKQTSQISDIQSVLSSPTGAGLLPIAPSWTERVMAGIVALMCRKVEGSRVVQPSSKARKGRKGVVVGVLWVPFQTIGQP